MPIHTLKAAPHMLVQKSVRQELMSVNIRLYNLDHEGTTFLANYKIGVENSGIIY